MPGELAIAPEAGQDPGIDPNMEKVRYFEMSEERAVKQILEKRRCMKLPAMKDETFLKLAS